MTARGSWLTYYQSENEEPVAIAVHSSELNAAREALATTNSSRVVRTVFVPFGHTIAVALKPKATEVPNSTATADAAKPVRPAK